MSIDNSKEQLEKAIKQERKKPLGIKYFLGNITNLKNIKSN